MKNLTVKPFKTLSDALDFLVNDKSCFTTAQLFEKLRTDGYCQFKKWHIVIDPNNEIELSKPLNWSRIAPALSNFFNGWRAKK